jgi:hypothetical protein
MTQVFFLVLLGLVGALKGDSKIGVGDDDGDDILAGFYFIAKLSRWAAGGSSNSSSKSSP